MAGYLYILASRRHGTLYTGCTIDLPKRIYEHRNELADGFTRKHAVKRLVYVETYDDISDAIVRERRIKEWKREWKIRLIEKDNPDWEDLAVSLLGFDPLPDPPAEPPPDTPPAEPPNGVAPAQAGAHEPKTMRKCVGPPTAQPSVHGSRPSPG